MLGAIVRVTAAIYVTFGFTVMTITSDGLNHPHAAAWGVTATLLMLFLTFVGEIAEDVRRSR